jgi:hypothetical protein
MNAYITAKMNLANLRKFRAALHSGLQAEGNPHIDAMFCQWAARYAASSMRRCNSASRGDGTWAPLAQRTLVGRARASISRVYRGFRAGDFDAAELQVKLKRARGVYRSQMKKMRANVAFRGDPGVSILRDTGTMLNALNIGAAGNVLRREGPVMKYGIGGPAGHPGGKLTIGRLAVYHQLGGSIPGRPPQREILVQPTAEVQRAMAQDASRAVRNMIREAR